MHLLCLPHPAIWVSRAQGEIKVVHAGPQVVPETLASRLVTIQSPVYQCNSPHILHAAIQTANYVVPL